MENSQQINTEIRISDIISTDFHSYRVLGMKQDLISLIRLNTNKIEIIFHRSADLLAMIESGEVNLVHQQRVQDENTESRSITVNDAFKEKLAIVTEIDRTFGPLYEDLIQRGKRNETIQNLILNYSYKKSNIYNLIRKWLQSGFNKNALIDHRNAKKSLTSYTNKTGRPRNPDVNHVKMIDAGIPLTNDVREHFEYGKRELLSGRSKNIRSAYSAVLGKYYTRIIVDDNTVRKERLPANECPTEAQFRYFIRKNVPKETLDRVKTSAREVRNDKRLLLSDSLYGIKGPMDIVEIDECELDVSLVSVEDRSIVVGRPVLYVMIDVYSRLIVGYSISFENNSIRGLTNCLLSLSDNMEEKCRKFGINLKPGLWPSGYLPYCIRSDYGSEYLSHAFTDICNALNIRKELVPPATGSLKGLVEQCFHQIHSRQNPNLQHKGLIEKRYDSDHHKTATLNIIHNAQQRVDSLDVPGLCASFVSAVQDMLVPRTMEALNATGYGKLAVAGGVAANSHIRNAFQQECAKCGATLYLPPLSLCGDNGAMIACQGYYEYLAGNIAGQELNAIASLSPEKGSYAMK